MPLPPLIGGGFFCLQVRCSVRDQHAFRIHSEIRKEYVKMPRTSDRQTAPVNLRMSLEVKDLLRLAAEREHRTLSNMLERLVLQHCEREGIELPPAPVSGKNTK